jgi:hypothetical protein
MSLAGIAFAGLQAKEVGFTVVGSLPGIFPLSAGTANKESASLSAEMLEMRQEEWKATLTRLAQEFQRGAAVVDPKKGSETCRYCRQALLCRIGETETLLQKAADEDEQHQSASANDENRSTQ